MRRHVEDEARSHGASICFAPVRSGHAEAQVRGLGLLKARITVQPIRSRVTYFAALHELGHVNSALASAQYGSEPGSVLRWEASAWSWALTRAIIEPSQQAWNMIHRSWFSYVLDTTDAPVPTPEWKRHVNSGGADLVPEWDRDWYRALWDQVRSAAGYAP
jgi:hypothetical protein